MLKPDEYYSTTEGSVIKCGECWMSDIAKTKKGEYLGDEATYEHQLELVSNDGEAWQCDECLKQNEAYDELGEEPE